MFGYARKYSQLNTKLGNLISINSCDPNPIPSSRIKISCYDDDLELGEL